MCGDPRPEHVGKTLTLGGWADTRRDHGGLVFVDLRDHTGTTQLVINPERSPAAAEVAKEIRNEFVLRARGEVVARAPETVNPEMPTGEVEVQLDDAPLPARRGGRRREPAAPLSLARPPHAAHAAEHAARAHGDLLDPADDG